MLINGLHVHHKENLYRLMLPDGTVVADLRFPANGESIDEARIVKIIIKHMKTIHGIA